MSDLKPWGNTWEEEKKARKSINPEKLCKFGIKALDDAMPFIQENELVLIGADSGAGKSELIIDIALHNSKNNKKVAVFYLEGGDEEFISRTKFKLSMQRLVQKTGQPQYIDYLTWKCNMMETSVLDDTCQEVFNELERQLEDNLWLYKVDRGFQIEDLVSALYGFHSLEEWVGKSGKIDLDLIIIDHLQYFELTGTENEIMQTTNIIREIKHLTDRYKVPVILVSHLRKKAKDRGLPSQEDFYGSSNIPKISTTSIMISSDKTKSDYSNNLYPTWIRFVKSRIGLRSNYVFKVNYDLGIRKYEDDYTIHRVLPDNTVLADPIEYNKLPYWVKKNVQQWQYERNFNKEE